MQEAHSKLTEVAKQPATQPGAAKAPGQGASSSTSPNLKRASSAAPKPNPSKPPGKARPATAEAAAPTRTSAEFTLIQEVSRAHQALACPRLLPSAACARHPLPLCSTADLFVSLRRPTASSHEAGGSSPRVALLGRSPRTSERRGGQLLSRMRSCARACPRPVSRNRRKSSNWCSTRIATSQQPWPSVNSSISWKRARC